MISELVEKGWVYFETDWSVNRIINHLQNESNSLFDYKQTILTPNKESEARVSLSKLFGNSRYPFHTDGVQHKIPPKYLVLKYIGSYKSRTRTILTDGYKLAEQHNLMFYHSIFYIRGNWHREFTPLVNRRISKDASILRYNPVIMDSLIPRKKVELERLIGFSDKVFIEWIAYSVLIVDNWRMLHSREELKDLDELRKLQRFELYKIRG